MINSDDLGSNVSEEKSDFEVAESNGSSRSKRRYNRRVRRYDDFSEKDLGLHALRLRFKCPFEGQQVVVTDRPSRVPFNGFFG